MILLDDLNAEVRKTFPDFLGFEARQNTTRLAAKVSMPDGRAEEIDIYTHELLRAHSDSEMVAIAVECVRKAME